MKNLVVLSGAGISKESGLDTFRDADGMWKEYDPRELASTVALANNPGRVMEFYNMRRKKMWGADPNAAHRCLAELEKKYNITIITQNVDDLHERAGSKNIIHIHGELGKVRSSSNPDNIIEVEKGREINLGDLASDGSQLRPHVVLFGEPVPKMAEAIEITKKADIFIVVGTSLQVYPAAELIDFTNSNCETYIVDPEKPSVQEKSNRYFIVEKATSGLPKLVHKLLDE
ncbi:MAG: NAD-dependent deacylase [Bacteroidota bacterium]